MAGRLFTDADRVRNITGLFSQIGGTIKGALEEKRAKQDEQDYNTYATMIQQGQNPEQQDIEINHKILIQAYSDVNKQRLQDQTYRQNKIVLARQEKDANKASFADNLSRMDAALTAGDEDAAKKYAVGAYRYINNGDNITINPNDGKIYTMKTNGQTGTLEPDTEFALPDWETIRTMGRQMLDKNTYDKIWLSNHMTEKSINAAAFNTADQDPVVDKQGNIVGLLGKFQKDGIPDWRFSATNTPDTVPWQQALQQGYMTKSAYDSREQTRMKKEAAEKKAVGGPKTYAPSDVEKVANLYAETYNISKKQALDLLRKEKFRDKALGIMQSIANQGLLDIESLEDQETLKSTFKTLVADTDIPILKPKGGVRGKRVRRIDVADTDIPILKPKGKRKEEVEEFGDIELQRTGPTGTTGEVPTEIPIAETEQPPMEGAKKASDGFWYIQRDGEWFKVVQ